MGFRYRKSVNLGGGFRVNFSKSGVGYSWGGKGFRITKTASGKTRTTVSIPGTGLSWTEESGQKRSKKPTVSQLQPSDTIHAYSVENAAVDKLAPAQLQDFLEAIKRYIGINSALTWITVIIFIIALFLSSNDPNSIISSIFILSFVIVFIYKIVHSIFNKVKVQYDFDEYANNQIMIIQNLIAILQSNKTIWQVNDIFHNTRTKVHAGASHSISRTPIRIIKKKPFFLNTNAQCYFVKLKKEQLFILPDKLIVINGGKIGVVDLADLDMSVEETKFVENIAPNDAQIIDYTWQYVNKNGTPDKRFKNNRRLSICRYGTISF